MRAPIAVILASLLFISTAVPAQPVERLPLDQGFFVASDTPCGEASNATLMLVHEDGINSSQAACSFTSIEQTGPTTFRAQERCQFIGVDEAEVTAITYEIPDSRTVSFETEHGWAGSARFCEQSSLPEPWSGNEL